MRTNYTVVRLIAVLLMTTISLAAHAQPNKKKGAAPVEVKNGPNNPVPVEVISSQLDPVTVSDQTIIEWRYIGLTQTEDDGEFQYGGLEGVGAMNKACAAEFGPSARAASIQEAFFRDDGAVDTRRGWVAPSGPMIVARYASGGDPQGGPFVAKDAATGINVGQSSITDERALTVAYCIHYGSITLFDPLDSVSVTSNGRIFSEGCDSVLPVACSAPVSVPVYTQ